LKKQTASSTFFTISFCEKAKNNCRGNSQIAPKKLSRYNVADVVNIVEATGRSPLPIGSSLEVHFGNQVIYVGDAGEQGYREDIDLMIYPLGWKESGNHQQIYLNYPEIIIKLKQYL
jgi:hypothetical protein